MKKLFLILCSAFLVSGASFAQTGYDIAKTLKQGNADAFANYFDAFVDLPNDQKGVHMSRNPEAISEVLDEVANDSSVEVETLCAKIVSKMMSKHEYAKRVEISMTTDYMFMKESPVTKNKTQEMAKLKAKAVG